MHFYNRKGFYAIVVQVIVDADRRFMWFSADHQGATADSTAWESTNRGRRRFANGEFPHPFFIVADAAYTCTESVLTPFHNKTDKDKDAYDYFQSHYRINVECALGMLQRRFGVFWRELAVPLDKVKYILHACMVLHNLSLDEKRVPVRTVYKPPNLEEMQRLPVVMQSDGCAEEQGRAQRVGGRQRCHERSQMRAAMLQRVKDQALTRPK